jgi:flagellar basal-body rod modification protein FlgD
MISSVSSATSSTTASSAMKSSMGMDSADFLQLFIAQLQYQDPLAPQDPSAMLDQLSQLSLVEQSYNTNTALANLLAAQNTNLSLSALSLVGNNIRANGNSISSNGTDSSSLQFNLSSASATTTLNISDASGNVVRTVNLGELASGDSSYTWDGCDNSGNRLSAGAYTFAVSGTSATGTALTATSYTTGKVDGIDFSGSVPYLKIGNVSVALTDVLNMTNGA